MDKLTLAVECCLNRSPEWDETCGKCPFNTQTEEEWSNTNCVDALILALYNRVKTLEGEK